MQGGNGVLLMRLVKCNQERTVSVYQLLYFITGYWTSQTFPSSLGSLYSVTAGDKTYRKECAHGDLCQVNVRGLESLQNCGASVASSGEGNTLTTASSVATSKLFIILQVCI